MTGFTIGLLAVTLSLDAFLASLGRGARGQSAGIGLALRTGAVFGAVEAVTPLIGWGLGVAALNGAILGLVAYGTYELTSWAIMRDWHPSMVAADMVWGATVTAISAAGGVLIARALS